ncbi:MAG: D-alanine--D-alanine ligase A [Chloroflexi bacterium]|nr:MAG: D-alanine--D-alanine ligase A [Chloroflexota bacterium]
MRKERSMRVGVIFGGRSGEHEVSLASARNVMEALSKAGHTVIPIGITPHGRWLTDGRVLLQLGGPASQTQGRELAVANEDPQAEDPWALLPQGAGGARLPATDVVFPVLHGPYGEDGTVQGLLEMANIPYVGSGVLASAVAMDKAVAKHLFAQAGIRQAAYQMVMRKRWHTEPDAVLADMEQHLAYPLFVKPANLGSSIGVSKARNRGELGDSITLACRFDRKVLVEAAVPNAREIEVSVLGNDEPIVSIPGEIVPGNEFYDYAAKYLDDNSQLLIPAPITEAQVREVQAMALRAYQAADCAGLARVDFLLDDASGAFYLNEINTMPGFTRISMYPKLWEASGISYPELVDRLIELALERHEDRMQNATTRTVSQDNGG